MKKLFSLKVHLCFDLKQKIPSFVYLSLSTILKGTQSGILNYYTHYAWLNTVVKCLPVLQNTCQTRAGLPMTRTDLAI